MTDKNSRVQRRADYARLKDKRHGHWGYGKYGWRSYSQHETNNMSAATAGMVANTPTPCSCYMCGNPRRNSWGDHPLTLQERKADDSFKDGLDDWDNWRYADWWDYDFDHSMLPEYYGENPAEDWYLKWLYMK